MGASSVTGTGLGAAKEQKGAKRARIGAEKIIGPRVVYAALVTLDGSGDLTVKLPKLPGVAANYVVLATDADAAAAAAVAVTFTMNATETTVVLKGAAASPVSLMVVRAGLAI